MNREKMPQIALIGNPNCGKTTIFNGLTGLKQHVGNWPGVTVEKKEGRVRLADGTEADLVDLPGIYSFGVSSEDERASYEYLLSRSADLYVNVADATSIERNLYLTLLLAETGAPMVVVLTMADIALQRRIKVDVEHLSEHLGVPVIAINGNSQGDLAKLSAALERALRSKPRCKLEVPYPDEICRELDILSSAVVKTSEKLRFPPKWVAMRALEGDSLVAAMLREYRDLASEIVSASSARVEGILGQTPDAAFAEARYGLISGLCKDVVSIGTERISATEILDGIFVNRFLGIPLFFGLIYVVFWLTQYLGGAFIDFFEISGNAVFVEGMRSALSFFGAPGWLHSLLADGLGAGVRTIASFIPPIFFMFLCLSLLEDSGYMARAAFVMDRAMRAVGLPGKSFVPLLVGFGCSVPAILATRTLESKRDRFLTVFMTPFMSCGAKLPVYVVFGAAFFSDNPGKMVFMLYLSGAILGILSGFMLRRTLFRGEPSHFIMELPPYHLPRLRHILIHTWERLSMFIFRAGKVIVPMVLLLGILNSFGSGGESLLSRAGKKMTPVFAPMGVEKENWPAAVALVTGLFAKESVVGTLTSIYGQEEGMVRAEEEPVKTSFLAEMGKAVKSIPDNIAALFTGEEEQEDGGDAIYGKMREHFRFGRHQAFAYLLFVLLYVPCVAATGAAFKELGYLFGTLFVCYLTTLGWSVATLYYQLSIGRNPLWIAAALLLQAANFLLFRLLGRRKPV